MGHLGLHGSLFTTPGLTKSLPPLASKPHSVASLQLLQDIKWKPLGAQSASSQGQVLPRLPSCLQEGPWGLEAARSSSPTNNVLFVERLFRKPRAQLLLEDPREKFLQTI